MSTNIEDLGKIDVLQAINYIRQRRDELIKDYYELLTTNNRNDCFKINGFRKNIDKCNEQLRMLEDCLIIIRLIESGEYKFE